MPLSGLSLSLSVFTVDPQPPSLSLSLTDVFLSRSPPIPSSQICKAPTAGSNERSRCGAVRLRSKKKRVVKAVGVTSVVAMVVIEGKSSITGLPSFY
ncbi:hypothetical protein TSUD_49380 [Trifolium subterraneum]|uniref:Uncharacterized protein n=1 Tax=Trifolium subterraneum TaxID=3900 RepID=A0A2Z6MYZ9_TRISU|nr:hypothetical protein TSUD_49380 [Trifolium subterraneum]